MSKICSKCGELKEFSEYHKSKNHSDGIKPSCKVCRNEANKRHRKLNPEYFQKWRDDNKSYVKNYNDKYRSENKEVLDAKKKEYVASNKELVAERKKAWYEDNKERILEAKKKRYEENSEEICKREWQYILNNPQARLRHAIRGRFQKAVKNGATGGTAIRNLGCTIEELKDFLESKFQPKMSWDNYGDWHIDHIVPLASFDLTDRDQVKQACHYTNLQPLWAEDNLRKGASLPEKI